MIVGTRVDPLSVHKGIMKVFRIQVARESRIQLVNMMRIFLNGMAGVRCWCDMF